MILNVFVVVVGRYALSTGGGDEGMFSWLGYKLAKCSQIYKYFNIKYLLS